MILVDTSIWIDHLRRVDDGLVSLLDVGEVLHHPLVIGELAIGSLRDRAPVLNSLADLPPAAVASHEEVLHLVEERGLHGKGLGWVDAHLLASALIGGDGLWTRDKRLRTAAVQVGVSAEGLI